MDTLIQLPASEISTNTKQDTETTADETELEEDLDASLKDR